MPVSQTTGNFWQVIRSQHWFARATALGISALLGLVAVVLFSRAVSGGFASALTPGQFLLAVLISLAPALIIRVMYARLVAPVVPAVDRWSQIFLVYGPSVAIAMLVISISLPGQRGLALFAGVMLVLIEEGVALWVGLRARRSGALERPLRRARPRMAPQHTSPEPAANASTAVSGPAIVTQTDQPGDESVKTEESVGDIVQEMRRIELPDGSQQWQGRCRTHFTASSRHAVEHLSFCPPFPHTPRVQCRAVEGPPARVRVGRVLPYGASVELRLAQVSLEPTRVTFEFTATVAPRGT